MIGRHDIKVTVSLDGPPQVNDLLRLSRTPNTSVSRLVEENIRQLREATGQPGQLEGVYTHQHVVHRCRVVDVLEYAIDRLGIGVVHLPINSISTSERHDPQGIRPEDLEWVLAGYAEATAHSLQQLVTRPVHKTAVLSTAYSIFAALLDPTPNVGEFICPAGNGTMAVDSNGDIYPCFMFFRQKHYQWGSVHEPEQPLIRLTSQREFLAAIRPDAIPVLDASWARRLIRGCAGANFFKNGHHGTISGDEVRLVESMVRAAVVELAHLATDAEASAYLPMAMRMFTGYLDAPMQ
jgi:uncharacterized protein